MFARAVTLRTKIAQKRYIDSEFHLHVSSKIAHNAWVNISMSNATFFILKLWMPLPLSFKHLFRVWRSYDEIVFKVWNDWIGWRWIEHRILAKAWKLFASNNWYIIQSLTEMGETAPVSRPTDEKLRKKKKKPKNQTTYEPDRCNWLTQMLIIWHWTSQSASFSIFFNGINTQRSSKMVTNCPPQRLPFANRYTNFVFDMSTIASQVPIENRPTSGWLAQCLESISANNQARFAWHFGRIGWTEYSS